MSEVNFGSTFRFPVAQQGVTKASKARLKKFLNSYENNLVGTGTTGYARVSMPNEFDEIFLKKIKALGFKFYQMFDGENISKKNLDKYIEEQVEVGAFRQFGKLNNKVTKNKYRSHDTELKDLIKSDKKQRLNRINAARMVQVPCEDVKLVNNVSVEEQTRIRQSQDYINMKEKYGEEFAEALFFLSRR